MVFAPLLQLSIPSDPIKDFAHVSMVVLSPFVLVAHPSVAAKNVAELVKLAKAKLGYFNFGTLGMTQVRWSRTVASPFTDTVRAEQPYDFRRNAARFVGAFFVRLVCGCVLLVDERHGVLCAERLALCFSKRRERLVHENDSRNALLPGLECVAHGGAGARASGAHTNDDVVDGFGERAELCVFERHPRVALVCALHGGGLRDLLERAFEPRPEISSGLILIPDESHAPA
jgi:hypothetical protein